MSLSSSVNSYPYDNGRVIGYPSPELNDTLIVVARFKNFLI